jgi:Family of unknown function (DUF5681)
LKENKQIEELKTHHAPDCRQTEGGGEAMNAPSEKYTVGYGRPPVHTQWKKGQTGNPRRIRKRDAKSAAALVDEFFAKEIAVVENGVSQRRTAFEIILLQLFNKTMAGNTRALDVLLNYRDFAATRGGRGVIKAELVAERQTQTK